MNIVSRSFSSFLNAVVSFHAYIVALMLVMFMIYSVGSSLYEFILNYQQALNLSITATGASSNQAELLHNLAFTFVLYKAFRVVLSYAQTLHVNLKFILEIAIVAPIVELIFNINSLQVEISIVLAAFAVAMSVVYLFFYKTIVKVDRDYKINECDDEEVLSTEPVEIEPAPKKVVRKKAVRKPRATKKTA